MKRLSIIMALILSTMSCSKLTQKSPNRAKNERFYKMDYSRPGWFYHQRCSKKRRKRECTKTYYNLNNHDEWKYFAPGFILIPFKYVFP